MSQVIRYQTPSDWIRFKPDRILQALTDAKGAVYALTTMPFQRAWVERLQQLQLKMEVAGTSRIEGAEFTEGELDAALSESPADAFTRSQRQARAALQTYRWIADLPPDWPVNEDLIFGLHRRLVTGCDDDHCRPGALRGADYNVTFGVPPHRGIEGGEPCEAAFQTFITALRTTFAGHDPLIQALAAHYHLAAMHPFEDGNGRTARAMEALLLQRAGLRDSAFVAMSNYYYDNKPHYLDVLAEVRRDGHDLTAFLVFGLKGIAQQCRRLFEEIRREMQKALFRDTMHSLFARLKSKRKRVMGKRQIALAQVLLNDGPTDVPALWGRVRGDVYTGLKAPWAAYVRDVSGLAGLRAIEITRVPSQAEPNRFMISPRLDWPAEITEGAFYEWVKQLPKSKSYAFLQTPEA